jgi:hypothetical protein
LLANVLLDEVDKELEKRGHAFVRYADDCNVYVRSRRAGERAMALLRRLFARLRLRVNETKSALDLAFNRQILGYSLWEPRERAVGLRVADKALAAMKERVRSITGRLGGRSMAQVVAELRKYLPGWRNYFSLADYPGSFTRLDQWIRRRLRAVHLKQWKRGPKVYRELRARGASHLVAVRIAAHTRRWWATSGTLNAALPNPYFDGLGVPRLYLPKPAPLTSTSRTARCGPARRVVWEGPSA